MRKPSFAVIMFVVLALIWITLLPGAPQAAEPAKVLRQNWEYKIMVLGGTDEESQINKLGAEGWELLSVVPSRGDVASPHVLFFKRPKP